MRVLSAFLAALAWSTGTTATLPPPSEHHWLPRIRLELFADLNCTAPKQTVDIQPSLMNRQSARDGWPWCASFPAVQAGSFKILGNKKLKYKTIGTLDFYNQETCKNEVGPGDNCSIFESKDCEDGPGWVWNAQKGDTLEENVDDCHDWRDKGPARSAALMVYMECGPGWKRSREDHCKCISPYPAEGDAEGTVYDKTDCPAVVEWP